MEFLIIAVIGALVAAFSTALQGRTDLRDLVLSAVVGVGIATVFYLILHALST